MWSLDPSLSCASLWCFQSQWFLLLLCTSEQEDLAFLSIPNMPRLFRLKKQNKTKKTVMNGEHDWQSPRSLNCPAASPQLILSFSPPLHLFVFSQLQIKTDIFTVLGYYWKQSYLHLLIAWEIKLKLNIESNNRPRQQSNIKTKVRPHFSENSKPSWLPTQLWYTDKKCDVAVSYIQKKVQTQRMDC